MLSCIRDSVVVITGASSGVGRAAAIMFAKRGAAVVLAARNARVLDEVAAECASAGGKALAVPTDVRDEAAVRALANAAVETFGKIDVWINNAAVALYARADDAPYAAYRHVIETNLLGVVHGARAALSVFRLQGRGVLIDNASVLGVIGTPTLSAYAAAKFGVVGLDQCLRQELLASPNIHVCTVLPASLDTPIFRHAGNFTGRAVKPIRPVYGVKRAARTMVRLAERPRRVSYVGAASPVIALLTRLAPGLMERAVGRYGRRASFQDRAACATEGNIFAPMSIWNTTSGGWRTSRGVRGILDLASVGAQLALELQADAIERLTRLVGRG